MLIGVKAVLADLDVLEANGKKWDIDFYQKSNDVLYDLLTNCYQVFDRTFLGTDDKERLLLKQKLVEKLEARGVRVLATTQVLTMFIRYIFNASSKRAFVYVNAIKFAIEKKVLPSQFKQFIIDSGGLEEISKPKEESEAKMDDKLQLSKLFDELKTSVFNGLKNPLGTIEQDGVAGDLAFLIVKPGVNISQIIHIESFVTSPQLDSILTIFAKRSVQDMFNLKPKIHLNKEDKELLKLAESNKLSNQSSEELSIEVSKDVGKKLLSSSKLATQE
jgi:hypothetical protein